MTDKFELDNSTISGNRRHAQNTNNDNKKKIKLSWNETKV